MFLVLFLKEISGSCINLVELIITKLAGHTVYTFSEFQATLELVRENILIMSIKQ